MAVVTASRALGVDLGSRRIGLALSDPTRTVASPSSVLERSGDRDHDHAAIVAAAREADATTIVVGLPLSLSGRSGPAAKAARVEIDAIGRLAEAHGISVVAHDERLTTVSAERSLNEARVKRADRKQVVDKVAAAIMLQSWLDGGERGRQS
jgi:putative Holliday junction resolvase